MSNADVRVDGAVALHSLQVVNAQVPGMSAAMPVFFKVQAGIQEHPIWAYDRLAVVVFCYTHVARQHTGDLSQRLEVSVDGLLISSDSCSSVLARSIRWHTSGAIRRVAEELISKFMSGSVTPEKLGIKMDFSTKSPPKGIVEAAQARQKKKG